MVTICRLMKLAPAAADALAAAPGTLAAAVAASDTWSDLYRYWHAIEHLLAKHVPDEPRLFARGAAAPPLADDLPPTRVLSAADVQALAALVDPVEPETLAPHYDAAAFDAAGVFPGTWVAWEEDFDPLGQVLEHFHFLRMFAQARAAAGDAMLLHFEPYDD